MEIKGLAQSWPFFLLAKRNEGECLMHEFLGAANSENNLAILSSNRGF